MNTQAGTQLDIDTAFDVPPTHDRLAAGDNSKPAEKGPKQFAKDQLRSIIERVERQEEEKKAIADDIRDIYTEAKANGYDVKALRRMVTLRKQNPTERQEAEATLEIYMAALGMI